MSTINVSGECSKLASAAKPVVKDWGFTIEASSELEALRLAYAYRNSPHGVKIDHCPNINAFLVTVWNESAKSMGISVD